MDHFQIRDGVLHAEDVSLDRIADEVGTPVYVYSRATLERHARVFREGLGELDNPLILFAVKANPNLAVLRVLQREGFGADVVSGGELRRALAAGMTPDKIVFSGVGKTRAELELGLDTGIAQFNIESREEGRELAELAAAREKAGTDGSVLTGEGLMRGRRVAVLVGEFGFLAGSIGRATADRLVAAINAERRLFA